MKVSVCVAVFNGAEYINEQIKSILFSSSVDEVIISDDGSTDGTLDIIGDIVDDRVRLIKGPATGVIDNFSNALHHATGDVFFLSDQDDVWTQDKIDKVLPLLNKFCLVVTDCCVVDVELKIINPSFFSINNSKAGLFHNLKSNGYLGCCMAFNKEVLDRALPFPPNIAMHDWWIGLIAETVGPVIFLEENLLLYRRHGNNVSLASEKSTYPLVKKVAWRISIAFNLFVRRFL